MLDRFLQSISQQAIARSEPVKLAGELPARPRSMIDLTPNAEGLLDAAEADEPEEPAMRDGGPEASGMNVHTAAPAGGRDDLSAFMVAASGVESGGNPQARNARTGAYGTFQIMPSNWSGWARDAGVDPGDKSALNQELVAADRMRRYFDQFGDWGAVAVAWYAGPAAAKAWQRDPNAGRFNKKQGKGNEPSINEYVRKIMDRMTAVG